MSAPVVTRTASGFAVQLSYPAPSLLAAVKAIPGRRYEGATRTWSIPASSEAQVLAFAAREGATLVGIDGAAAAAAATAAPSPTAKAPAYAPTPEQQAVIDAAVSGRDLKVAAYAGAGKTSTLVLVAEALAPRRGAYLAFNKVTATEARERFPRNVECRTIHSFAFAATEAGRRFKRKLDLRGYPSLYAQLLGVPADGSFGRSQAAVVRAVLALIRGFMQSADAAPALHHLDAKHLAAFAGADDESVKGTERKALAAAREGFCALVVELATRLWALSVDEDRADVPMTHDHYLKLWQLSGATLPVDFILVDEAQDLNPVTLAIVTAHRCQRIWVGDTHQQIYAWRGAVNAMETIEAPVGYITQSFRWGSAVADVANAILSLKGDLPHPVRGFDRKPTLLAPVDSGPVTVICRGNAALFSQALAAVTEGKRLAVVGSLDEPIRLMESAYALKAGRVAEVQHPDIKVFATWEEMLVACEDDHSLEQIKKRVEEYGDRIPGLCLQLRAAGEVPEDRADVVLTTAHKAKGREWPQVRLAGDYCSHLAYLRKGQALRVEELNILYVAATRATHRLELNWAAEELMDPYAVEEAFREGGLTRGGDAPEAEEEDAEPASSVPAGFRPCVTPGCGGLVSEATPALRVCARCSLHGGQAVRA